MESLGPSSVSQTVAFYSVEMQICMSLNSSLTRVPCVGDCNHRVGQFDDRSHRNEWKQQLTSNLDLFATVMYADG